MRLLSSRYPHWRTHGCPLAIEGFHSNSNVLQDLAGRINTLATIFTPTRCDIDALYMCIGI